MIVCYRPHPKAYSVCPHLGGVGGWGSPARSDGGGGVPWPGQIGGGSNPRQVMTRGTPGRIPPAGVPPRTAHGVLDKRRRYASCVHAGGLSCFMKRTTSHWKSRKRQIVDIGQTINILVWYNLHFMIL